MIFKRILRIFSGVLLVVLGIQLMLADYGDFGVIGATTLIIAGGSLLLIEHWNKADKGRNAQKEQRTTDSWEENKEIPDADEPVSKSGTGAGWLGITVLLALLVFMQSTGVVGNWLSPEARLDSDEFMEILSSANVIEMRGVLKSTNEFTYLYVNDERVGTVKNKGLWNMKWLFMNKGENLYSFTYSDHNPDESKYTTYEFTDQDGEVLCYSQTATEDGQHMLYFYNGDDKPVGYVNIEPDWVFYRDNWMVYSMEDVPAYRVTASYDAVNKQLSYVIVKQKDSEINVLQVMGLDYLTRGDISRYYD